MPKKSRVLSIAFVTGEDIEPKGLPILKIYKGNNQYMILEGDETITSALVQSLEHLDRRDHTVLFLAIEITSQSKTKGGEV